SRHGAGAPRRPLLPARAPGRVESPDGYPYSGPHDIVWRAAMITIDHGPRRISIAVFGEFTLADYKEFEELFTYKSRFEGPVNLLVDLRGMASFTLDVAWEDLRFAREHRRDFGRVAVLTTSQWVGWSAWMTQMFVDGEVRVFEDEGEARMWLDETEESAE